MTAPMPQHTVNANASGSAFSWQEKHGGFSSGTEPEAESRLAWLELNTNAPLVHRALVSLFAEAMQQTSDARRAGHFLLCLWSPSQYHLDLNDLGFFEEELNYAARHLVNFIVACQVNFRQIVTYREMEPIFAAWGEHKP